MLAVQCSITQHPAGTWKIPPAVQLSLSPNLAACGSQSFSPVIGAELGQPLISVSQLKLMLQSLLVAVDRTHEYFHCCSPGHSC